MAAASLSCIIEYNVILLPLQLFAAISTIWFTHRYRMEFKSTQQKDFGSKNLYCHSLNFFILIALFFVLQCFDVAIHCYPQLHAIYSNINIINSMVYGTESCNLMVLLFYRLYHVFNNTSYALSRRSIILYVCIYGINVASGIVSIFVYSDYHHTKKQK
eukprot:938080_1